ncbi:MAG: murein DD-endopeptidase [Gammaproteobacteria bacterium]|jgi:murein DD-endopeptidase
MIKILFRLLLIVLFAGLNGCSTVPQAPVVERSTNTERIISNQPSDDASDKGSEIFSYAQSVLGTAYRYGGADPSGFDCSGLVEYSHLHAGIRVPRTSLAQYDAAQSVPRSALKPGDVIFFNLDQKKTSHVGIYAGKGRFIHAPSTGKYVSFANLSEPYWKERIVKTGRLY